MQPCILYYFCYKSHHLLLTMGLKLEEMSGKSQTLQSWCCLVNSHKTNYIYGQYVLVWALT